jgi:hypothetical protein
VKIAISLKSFDKVEKTFLRASWELVTFGEFLQLTENSKIENEAERTLRNISLLSGIKVDTLNQFDSASIESLKPFLSFIDNVDYLFSMPTPESLNELNIGLETWGKLESAKQYIMIANDSLFPIVPNLLDIYYPTPNFMDMTMDKSYPIARAMITKLDQFFQKYIRLNDYKPSSDQIAAGIDKLNQYGFFATLHAISNGNPLKYDDMLNQPADVIYQTLLMDFEVSEYQKRLQEKLNKKTK